MQVRFLKPDELELLDGFVAQHPRGSIEQTWNWGVLQTSIEGRESMFVFGVFEKKKLIGSMLVVRQHMGRGKYWLWCPRGPLLPEKNAAKAWGLLKEACKELAGRGGDVFMRVETGAYVGDEVVVQGVPSKEIYVPQHTLMLSLDVSEESILKQMKQKGRYNIKQAHKAGVYVLRSKGADLDDFYDVLVETAKRDGFYLHDKQYYRLFFDLMDGRLLFYTAYHEDDFLGGIFVTHLGDTATYYFGASSGKKRSVMAPYATQWFAMQEAKKAGMKTYDFFGIAPEGDAKHHYAGVTQFKTRFGGKRVDYQQAQVFVYRRFWWYLRKIAKLFKRS